MKPYGDSEPEDAWDAGDPVPVLFGNIARRAIILAIILATLGDDQPDRATRGRIRALVEHLDFLTDRVRRTLRDDDG